MNFSLFFCGNFDIPREVSYIVRSISTNVIRRTDRLSLCEKYLSIFSSLDWEHVHILDCEPHFKRLISEYLHIKINTFLINISSDTELLSPATIHSLLPYKQARICQHAVFTYICSLLLSFLTVPPEVIVSLIFLVSTCDNMSVLSPDLTVFSSLLLIVVLLQVSNLFPLFFFLLVFFDFLLL